ncbi:MAG: pilus assembly protein PilM [Patescibacteria group bacterium]
MNLRSLFEHILPPPAYLLMESIGVDISDTSLKYIKFSESGHLVAKHKLQAWGELDIPEGVLKRGQVSDQKKLTEVLQQFKEITKAEYVRVSLPEEKAYLFETEIKRSTPAKEIRGLLEFRLEENVPIPAREAFFDYDILEHDTTDKVMRIVVVAYARETILNYYDACIAAKLIPVSFEVEAQAMVTSVLPEGLPGAHMLVDFGKTRTGIGIVFNGVLMYTSTIDFGGNQLSEILRKEMGDLTESELTDIKNNQGLIKGVNDTICYDALISTISVIKDEIESRIQYWHAADYKQKERRIQSITLCGGSINLKGLPEYFSEVLNIKTVRADVWQNAFSVHDVIPPIDLRHSYGYATAIGLALKKTV